QSLPLLLRRRSRQAQSKRIVDLASNGRGCVKHDALAQDACRFEKRRLVQAGEGLQRGVRARPPREANLAARRVESREGRIGANPPPKRIQAAAVKLRSLTGRPLIHADFRPEEANFLP